MNSRNLSDLIDENEEILWCGKPNKKCFLLETVFNPFLPFALFWGIFDILGFSSIFFGAKSAHSAVSAFFLIPFFAFHMMPVWLYLAGVCSAVRNYKNTCFAVTEKGVYSAGGFLAFYFRHKAFSEIAEVSVRQGFFDRKLHVGDVVIVDRNRITGANPADAPSLQDINKATSYRIPAEGFKINMQSVKTRGFKYQISNDIIFHDIPDFAEVCRLITDLAQKHKP